MQYFYSGLFLPMWLNNSITKHFYAEWIASLQLRMNYIRNSYDEQAVLFYNDNPYLLHRC